MSDICSSSAPDWMLSLLVPLHGSQPQAGAHALATALAKTTWRRLQQACQDDGQFADLCVALAGMELQEWPTTAAWWCPELGMAMAHFRRGRLRDSVLFFLLAAHGAGVSGEWELPLAQAQRLSFAGNLFNAEGRVKARCHQGRLQLWVLAAPAAALCWQRAGARWVLESGQEASPICQLASGAALQRPGFEDKMVQSWTLPSSYQSGDDPEVNWPPSLPEPELGHDWRTQVAMQASDALGLLGELHPNYLPWCQPLLRGIAACKVPNPQMLISGSYRTHAGMLTVGFPVQLPLLAETLVHEISHQYYSLLSLAVPLIDKQVATGLYYSSFKRKHRPLEKILFAFHATANMAFYWHRVLQQSGPWQDLADRELGKLVGYIGSLAQTLRDAPGLSPTGQACFALQSTMLLERGLSLTELAPH
ncbi:aKG-HExxH-type peptide beta-hydroxylase [Roseateles sp. DB2]|uniref:aKG-HExxH-type peptide beta-hydroxylase n=1 Tax=Roseateles sp. DB2 TaxID=3453717 RepID=UPI003EEBED1C